MEDRDAPPPASFEERVEGWIRTMLAESMLGPLLAVILGHVVAFLAPVILLGLRDRSPAALAALAILIVGSASALQRDWRRYRRPGPIGGALLVSWSFAGIAAWAAGHYGIL